MRKSSILAGILWIWLTACGVPAENTLEQVVGQACSYLWSQQDKDGAWRSRTHRVMGAGHALTPFILWVLLQVPESSYPLDQSKVNLSLEYLRSTIDQQDRLGFPKPGILEYPNYANAYALMLLSSYGENSVDSLRILKLQQYLTAQQFTELRGISPDHAAYGGWGFGEDQLPSGIAGQVDLSHTRRIIQALTTSQYPIDRLLPDVEIFLARSQGVLKTNGPDSRNAKRYSDGGFHYSTVIMPANKAGMRDSAAISYPTATCDGFLALHLAGIAQGQMEALSWLENHSGWFDWGLETPQGWSSAMRFYHLMVRSEVHRIYPDRLVTTSYPGQWLMAQQRGDGSFQNAAGAISKEDDPLLATAMALITLVNCYLDDN